MNVVIEYESALFGGHDSIPSVGSYHFGKHLVVIDPPEEDRLALSCVFDGYNLDRCDGYISHEGSQEVCAELIFVRHHGTAILLHLSYNSPRYFAPAHPRS